MTQVVLLSPCGWGNLGDAAIQEAAIAGVRRHFGDDVHLVALTQNPTDTAARHGITAYRIAGFEVPNYSLGPNPSAHSPAPAGHMHEASASIAASAPEAARTSALKRILNKIPFLDRTLRTLLRPIRAVFSELRHWVFALRLMSASRLLVVSGGGQLDEFWGGPWGHPYAMFKWATAAQLTGCRVVFLSVGAGTLSNATTRRLVRSALRRAFYLSFRDPRTVTTVDKLSVGGQLNLFPDLAFSHPAARLPRPAIAHQNRRLIGLSPIVYKDPDRWPEKDGAFFSSYLDELALFGIDMLMRGDAIVVLTSDYADNSAADELMTRIRRQVPTDAAVNLSLPANTEQLLELLQRCDALVASRLHGVILAQIAATPVVAVSYNWKVDEQMELSKCVDLCVSIEKFSAGNLVRLVDIALNDRVQLSGRLAKNAASAFVALDAQYDAAFRGLASRRKA